MSEYHIQMDQNKIAALTDKDVELLVFSNEVGINRLRSMGYTEYQYINHIVNHLLPKWEEIDSDKVHAEWSVNPKDSSIPLEIVKDRYPNNPPKFTSIQVDIGLGETGVFIALSSKFFGLPPLADLLRNIKSGER